MGLLDPGIPGTSLKEGGALRGVTQAETGIGLPSVEEGSSREPVTMEET